MGCAGGEKWAVGVSCGTTKGVVNSCHEGRGVDRGRLTGSINVDGGCLSGVRGKCAVPDLRAFARLDIALNGAPSFFLLKRVERSVIKGVRSSLGLYSGRELGLVCGVIRLLGS